MLTDSLATREAALQPETRAARERRRNLGIYYTPPEAAKALASWAIRQPGDTVLEPSFGGCAMLAAAVGAFTALGNTCPSKQLYGYDIDPAAFIHLAQMGLSNARGQFKKQNFLNSEADGVLVDAVLANPPFVSYHRLNASQRRLADRLRKRYLPELPKFASLWVHFVLHSLSFLRIGGRMAFVLPIAISTADYAQPLLEFLRSRFSKVRLINVNERLFIQAGAKERTSILLLDEYSPKKLEASAEIQFKHVSRISEIFAGQGGDRSVPSEREESLREKSIAALNALRNSVLECLGQSTTVQIGEVVGDIKFFVRPLSHWRQLKIDKPHAVSLLTRSAQVRGIYVGRGQHPTESSPIPYLLLPPVSRLPGAIKNYLAEYPESDRAANQTFLRRSVWHRCSYSTTADAFIGSINHDFPRIIANDAGISCSNAFYKISVRQERSDLKAWLPILSLTTPFRLSAEILGRVRGSGGIKLEPSDVKKLLIPQQLPKLSIEEFELLKNRICRMLQGGELDSASQLADSRIFLKSKLINAQTMSNLRDLRLALTSRRLSKPMKSI